MENSVLKVGHNCHNIKQANYAAVIIDYANYYRALYESISKARRFIFVLGWDIDSRILLLRGEEATKAKYPVCFFDLIQWKARQNAQLEIYLNCWDYAFYMAAEREIFASLKWRLQSPSNIHFCLDSTIPFKACHHQKIVIIDGEIAFCGGMDVAQCRWDHREHYLIERHRKDVNIICRTGWKRFGPYHDVQMLVAGPIVDSLSDLVRFRWHGATGKTIPQTYIQTDNKFPIVWPKSTKPNFTNVNVGMALTMPPLKGESALYEIEQLYIDMISQAKNFIYIENQYLTQQRIAAALNLRLKQVPRLRVLLVSSYNPQGIVERKSMWHARALFRDTLEKDGITNRIVMAYPASCEKGTEKTIRIHSKLMVVDDSYLRIGSSNINNRSIKHDTECDLVIEANNSETRLSISAVRSDLIREHTGREIEDIEYIINTGASVEKFLEIIPHSRQHLYRINDECFRNERFARFTTWIADPA